MEEAAAPLKAFENPATFKLYLADTGLLSARCEAMPQDVEPASDKGAVFRGALAENYVYQQICASDASAHYWGTASRAEVEFVARTKEGDVISIEVRPGANVASKSLNAFARAYEPACAVRVSARNIGFENGVRSVPLYAAWCLGEDLQ